MMQKLVSDLFWKIKIEHISNNLMINGVRFYTVFLMYAKLRAIETYWN